MTAFALIATDLDGTLVRSDGSVSARTQGVLRRVEARGLPVVLVTARPPRVARHFAAAAGTTSPLICCNGALVYDPLRDAVVRHAPIAPEAAVHLVGLISQAVPGACFAAELGVAFAQDVAWAALAAASAGEPFEVGQPGLHDDPLALCREPVTKLLVRHPVEQVEALLALVRALAGGAVAVTHSGGPFVELSAAGVHKAFALEGLCAELGVGAAEVLAFGDMPNDLPMLAWAGRAVAVANAHPDVLAVADEVTAANDDDGVARALERLVLGGG